MLFIVLILAVFAFVTVLTHRYRSNKISTSGGRQVDLIKIVLYCNLPLFAFSLVIAYLLKWTEIETVSAFFYLAISFNCFAYSYFHFFNMSETSRRIRLLIEIKRFPGVSRDQLRDIYSPADIVMQRIKRLEDMDQIRCSSNGEYVVTNRFLLNVATIIQFISRIIAGRQYTN